MTRNLTTTAVLLLALCTSQTSATEDLSKRSIEVTGVGLVTQSPDIARVSFAVETQGQNAEKANKQNAERTRKVTKALKKLGIALEDLQTRDYSVSPRYRDRTRRDEDLVPIGFVVSNRVSVVIRKLADVGRTIDGAVKAGATRVSSIRFELEDPSEARGKALGLAMQSARAEAVMLLSETSHKLGRILQIRTHGGHHAPRMERAMMSAAKMDTPIEPGTLDTRAQVSVVFEITD